MSYTLLATVFNNDLTMVGTYPALSYNLMFDAIANETSTIIIKDTKGVSEGGYIAMREHNSSKILYYGQIITVDTDTQSKLMTLSTNYIWNVLNGDILVTNRTGESYEQHIKVLIQKYSTALGNVFQDLSTGSFVVPYEVASSDGAQVKNFIDYLIRGFKLHNVVLSVDGISQGILPNGKPYFYPKMVIKQINKTVSFNDQNWAFRNFKVTDSRNLRGYANELWIVDKATVDMENPTIMGKYWLQTDGLVVNRINDLVNQPTQVSLFLYDKTATDNPDNDSIGRANLGGNSYSHNIQFSVDIKNEFLGIDNIMLGLQANIFYQGKTYKSILTGYELSSDSNEIHFTFGNLRFGKKDLASSDI